MAKIRYCNYKDLCSPRMRGKNAWFTGRLFEKDLFKQGTDEKMREISRALNNITQEMRSHRIGIDQKFLSQILGHETQP